MAQFKISTTSIIEKARNLFLSEDFISAFNLIHQSFEIEEQDIISLLKGELDLIDLDLLEGSDNNYIKECKEILSNHDFLFKLNNDTLQIKSKHIFDISIQKNEIATLLREQENTIISNGFLFTLLSDMLKKNKYYDIKAIIFSDNYIYILDTFNQNIYSGISKYYNDTQLAIESFNKFN